MLPLKISFIHWGKIDNTVNTLYVRTFRNSPQSRWPRTADLKW
jgi:hypothetical protein